MSFFSRDAPPPEPEEHREPYRRRPTWRGPSGDEVGRPLASSFVLARSDSAAVVVQALHVHSDGCLFDISWAVRRTTEDTATWREVSDTSIGHAYRSGSGADALLFGAELSDGSRTRTSDRFDRRDPGDQPRLVLMGQSGSGGGTERIHGNLQLWLHPLPPLPTMDLICAWAAVGVPETRRTIDTAEIRAAGSAAHLIWPDDADLPTAEDA